MRARSIILKAIAIGVVWMLFCFFHGAPWENSNVRLTVTNYLKNRYSFPMAIHIVKDWKTSEPFRYSHYRVYVVNNTNGIRFSVHNGWTKDDYFSMYWRKWVEEECEEILNLTFNNSIDIISNVDAVVYGDDDAFQGFYGEEVPDYKTFMDKAVEGRSRIAVIIYRAFEQDDDVDNMLNFLMHLDKTEIIYNRIGFYYKVKADPKGYHVTYFTFTRDEVIEIINSKDVERISNKSTEGASYVERSL